MKYPSTSATAGFSIVEAAVAAGIIAVALSSMFTFNSACLALVRNAKESAASMLSNQQRIEQLRSRNWSNITDSNYWVDTANNASDWLTTIMIAPTQSGAALTNATEVVRVSDAFQQTAPGDPINTCHGISDCFVVTRTSAGPSITDQHNAVNLVNSKMLRIDTQLTWTTLGGRGRSRQSSGIISKGGLTINETSSIAPITW